MFLKLTYVLRTSENSKEENSCLSSWKSLFQLLITWLHLPAQLGYSGVGTLYIQALLECGGQPGDGEYPSSLFNGALYARGSPQ